MGLVTLTVLSEGTAIDPTFRILSMEVTKEVNRIPFARVVLVDGDPARQTFPASDSEAFEPGKAIVLKLRDEDAPGKEAVVFEGLVVRHTVEASARGTLLTVEMKDAAVRLTGARKRAVFHDLTDGQVIGQILKARGLMAGAIPATTPTHAQLVQYLSTDWDFILLRADALGLWVLADDGTVSLHAVGVEGSPAHRFEFGIDEIFRFEMEADAEHQLDVVTSVAWDAAQQQMTTEAKAQDVTVPQGNLAGGRLAHALGADPAELSTSAALAPEELQGWSDATLARSRMALLRGHLTVPGRADIRPMDVIEVAGIGARFNGTTVVTGVRHQVDEDGWATDLQIGASSAPFAERPGVGAPAASGLLPGVRGLQIATVAAFEADPDEAFRAQVILPGIDPKTATVWARLAAPDAGKGRGWFFRPEPGDEVVVGFLDDDPRQPIVLGGLYSATNTLPEGFTVEEKNDAKGLVTRGGSTIRLVDEAGAEAIEIRDAHENSIVMNKDGVTVTSAKDLTLSADGKVKISGSAIDLN